MLRTLLLAVSIFFVWSSPELRKTAADGLRMTAQWIEPKEGSAESHKHFRIPNPFYKEE